MNNLANDINDQTDLTPAGLVDFARKYFVEDIPEQDSTLELKHPTDLASKGLVDSSGKLHGQNPLFEYFIRTIERIALDEIKSMGIYKVNGNALTPGGIQSTIISQTNIGSHFFGNYLIDPLNSSEESIYTVPEIQTNQHKEYEYLDKPVIVHIPGKSEWEEQKQKIGEIRFVSPQVFEGVNQRLIQQRLRNTNLPIQTNTYDLVLEVQNERLAYIEQDPFIFGMEIVARDGNICYFQLDRKNTQYISPGNELPQHMLSQMLEICNDLGMDQLSHDLLNQPLTIKRLGKILQNNVQGYIPEESREVFVKNIYHLLKKDLIDNQGKLRGGYEVFSYLFRSLLVRAYGEESVNEQSGFSLHKDTTVIDATIHRQLHVNVPARQGFPGESIDCILGMEPIEQDFTSDAYIPQEVYKKVTVGSEIPLRPGQKIANEQDEVIDLL